MADAHGGYGGSRGGALHAGTAGGSARVPATAVGSPAASRRRAAVRGDATPAADHDTSMSSTVSSVASPLRSTPDTPVVAGSTIAAYIKAFRENPPTSPEVRRQREVDAVRRQDFWWVDNGGEHGDEPGASSARAGGVRASVESLGSTARSRGSVASGRSPGRGGGVARPRARGVLRSSPSPKRSSPAAPRRTGFSAAAPTLQPDWDRAGHLRDTMLRQREQNEQRRARAATARGVRGDGGGEDGSDPVVALSNSMLPGGNGVDSHAGVRRYGGSSATSRSPARVQGASRTHRAGRGGAGSSVGPTASRTSPGRRAGPSPIRARPAADTAATQPSGDGADGGEVVDAPSTPKHKGRGAGLTRRLPGRDHEGGVGAWVADDGAVVGGAAVSSGDEAPPPPPPPPPDHASRSPHASSRRRPRSAAARTSARSPRTPVTPPSQRRGSRGLVMSAQHQTGPGVVTSVGLQHQVGGGGGGPDPPGRVTQGDLQRHTHVYGVGYLTDPVHSPATGARRRYGPQAEAFGLYVGPAPRAGDRAPARRNDRLRRSTDSDGSVGSGGGGGGASTGAMGGDARGVAADAGGDVGSQDGFEAAPGVNVWDEPEPRPRPRPAPRSSAPPPARQQPTGRQGRQAHPAGPGQRRRPASGGGGAASSSAAAHAQGDHPLGRSRAAAEAAMQGSPAQMMRHAQRRAAHERRLRELDVHSPRLGVRRGSGVASGMAGGGRRPGSAPHGAVAAAAAAPARTRASGRTTAGGGDSGGGGGGGGRRRRGRSVRELATVDLAGLMPDDDVSALPTPKPKPDVHDVGAGGGDVGAGRAAVGASEEVVEPAAPRHSKGAGRAARGPAGGSSHITTVANGGGEAAPGSATGAGVGGDSTGDSTGDAGSPGQQRGDSGDIGAGADGLAGSGADAAPPASGHSDTRGMDGGDGGRGGRDGARGHGVDSGMTAPEPAVSPRGPTPQQARLTTSGVGATTPGAAAQPGSGGAQPPASDGGYGGDGSEGAHPSATAALDLSVGVSTATSGSLKSGHSGLGGLPGLSVLSGLSGLSGLTHVDVGASADTADGGSGSHDAPPSPLATAPVLHDMPSASPRDDGGNGTDGDEPDAAVRASLESIDEEMEQVLRGNREMVDHVRATVQAAVATTSRPSERGDPHAAAPMSAAPAPLSTAPPTTATTGVAPATATVAAAPAPSSPAAPGPASPPSSHASTSTPALPRTPVSLSPPTAVPTPDTAERSSGSVSSGGGANTTVRSVDNDAVLALLPDAAAAGTQASSQRPATAGGHGAKAAPSAAGAGAGADDAASVSSAGAAPSFDAVTSSIAGLFDHGSPRQPTSRTTPRFVAPPKPTPHPLHDGTAGAVAAAAATGEVRRGTSTNSGATADVDLDALVNARLEQAGLASWTGKRDGTATGASNAMPLPLSDIPASSSTLQLLSGSRVHGGVPHGPASAAAAAAGVGVTYLNLSGGRLPPSRESLGVGTSVDDLLQRLHIPANPFGSGAYRGGDPTVDSVEALLGDLDEYLDPQAVLDEDPEETVARLRRRFRAIDNQFGVSNLSMSLDTDDGSLADNEALRLSATNLSLSLDTTRGTQLNLSASFDSQGTQLTPLSQSGDTFRTLTLPQAQAAAAAAAAVAVASAQRSTTPPPRRDGPRVHVSPVSDGSCAGSLSPRRPDADFDVGTSDGGDDVDVGQGAATGGASPAAAGAKVSGASPTVPALSPGSSPEPSTDSAAASGDGEGTSAKPPPRPPATGTDVGASSSSVDLRASLASSGGLSGVGYVSEASVDDDGGDDADTSVDGDAGSGGDTPVTAPVGDQPSSPTQLPSADGSDDASDTGASVADAVDGSADEGAGVSSSGDRRDPAAADGTGGADGTDGAGSAEAAAVDAGAGTDAGAGMDAGADGTGAAAVVAPGSTTDASWHAPTPASPPASHGTPPPAADEAGVAPASQPQQGQPASRRVAASPPRVTAAVRPGQAPDEPVTEPVAGAEQDAVSPSSAQAVVQQQQQPQVQHQPQAQRQQPGAPPDSASAPTTGEPETVAGLFHGGQTPAATDTLQPPRPAPTPMPPATATQLPPAQPAAAQPPPRVPATVEARAGSTSAPHAAEAVPLPSLGPAEGDRAFSAPEVAAWLASLPPGPFRDAVLADKVTMTLLQQMEQYERALVALVVQQP